MRYGEGTVALGHINHGTLVLVVLFCIALSCLFSLSLLFYVQAIFETKLEALMCTDKDPQLFMLAHLSVVTPLWR